MILKCAHCEKPVRIGMVAALMHKYTCPFCIVTQELKEEEPINNFTLKEWNDESNMHELS